MSTRSDTPGFQTELKTMPDASCIRAFSVVGCITEMCIDATARTGASLGFDVTVVSDAHSTPDACPPDGPTPQMRIQWFNHVMARLAGLGLTLAVRDSSNDTRAATCSRKKEKPARRFNTRAGWQAKVPIMTLMKTERVQEPPAGRSLVTDPMEGLDQLMTATPEERGALPIGVERPYAVRFRLRASLLRSADFGCRRATPHAGRPGVAQPAAAPASQLP